MKCTDIQQAIWLGQRTKTVEAHLQNCANCRTESSMYEAITKRLRSTDRITPSKSLLPSQDVIRQAVKRNKRKPILRITTIAASVVLVSGAALGLASMNKGLWNSTSSQSNKNTQVATSKQNWIETEPNMQHPELLKVLQDYLYKRFTNQEIKHMQIQSFVLEAGADDATSNQAIVAVTLQVDVQPNAKIELNQGQNQYSVQFKRINGVWEVANFEPAHSHLPTQDLVVKVASGAANPTICDSIRAYLGKVSDFRTLKTITIKGFEQDPQSTSSYIFGKATVDVDTFPSVEAPLEKGTNTLYVLLTKQQGLWTVSKVDTQPLHASDVPDYAKPFAQAAQKLQGKVAEVSSSEVDLGNGQKGNMLTYIILDIQQNLTPAGSWQAGKQIRIDYGEVIPQSSSFQPKVGDLMVIEVAYGNSAAAAGEDIWISHLQNTYYQQNGMYYDGTGKQANPLP